MLLKDVCVIDTGISSLVTHAVGGRRCAARAGDGILGHSSLDLGQQLDSRVYIDTAVMPSQAMRHIDTNHQAFATQVGH